MLNYEWRHDEGILALHPEEPLEAADFISITSQIDTYLAEHGKLRGVLIRAKSFPGWKDFAALLAHLKFLKEHIQRIEKIAIVADGTLAKVLPNILPSITNYFIHAQVQHFDSVREDAAWDWLREALIYSSMSRVAGQIGKIATRTAQVVAGTTMSSRTRKRAPDLAATRTGRGLAGELPRCAAGQGE